MMKQGAVYAALVSAMLLTACDKNAQAGGDLQSAFGGVPDNTETVAVADCTAAAINLTYVSDGQFAFVNKGKHACSMQGYPTLKVLDGSKTQLPVRIQRDTNTKPVPVTIEPGGKAVFMVASDQSYGACASAGGVTSSAPGLSYEMTAMGATKICGNYAYLTPVQAPPKG